jgi:aromatic ring hydroxylase
MNDRKQRTAPDDTVARVRETAASLGAKAQEEAAAAKATAQAVAPKVTRAARDLVKRAWPVATAAARAISGAVVSAIARIRRERK